MNDQNKDVQQIAGSVKQSRVPPTAFDSIAAALQQIHLKTTDEVVPDDFMDLLNKFDALDKDK